jgi:hypothetical protein
MKGSSSSSGKSSSSGSGSRSRTIQSRVYFDTDDIEREMIAIARPAVRKTITIESGIE